MNANFARSLLRIATSGLLAGLYLCVALFGWSFHSHRSCGHTCSAGHHESAGAGDCGCGGELCGLLAGTESSESLPEEATFSDSRSRQPGHDPHDCAVCSLLASLKTGHATASASDFSTPLVLRQAVEYTPLAIPAPLSGLSARGPPSRV